MIMAGFLIAWRALFKDKLPLSAFSCQWAVVSGQLPVDGFTKLRN